MTDSHYYSAFQNASFVLYEDCMHEEADADIETLMFLFIQVLFCHLFYYLSLAFFLLAGFTSPHLRLSLLLPLLLLLPHHLNAIFIATLMH